MYKESDDMLKSVSISAIIICLLILAYMQGCGPKVALWQDQAGGPNPYVATVKCRPSPIPAIVDIRAPAPVTVVEVNDE